MCDPVTAIAATATAFKIGSTIIEHKAQNKQAAAVEDAALGALKVKDHELSLREVQERIAGNQQLAAGSRSVTEAVGTANASAAVRGVGGMTTDLLLGDIERQGAEYAGSVNDQTIANIDQVEREKESALAEAQGRVNSAPKASLLGSALKIGAAAADFASLKIGQRPVTPKTPKT